MNDNDAPPLLIDYYDWHTNCDGTYCSWSKEQGYHNRVIPAHPEMNKIYKVVFNYALEGYTRSDCIFEKCIEQVEEKFGKLSEDVKDYLEHCPYDAGLRAGMLIEEPDHYN